MALMATSTVPQGHGISDPVIAPRAASSRPGKAGESRRTGGWHDRRLRGIVIDGRLIRVRHARAAAAHVVPHVRPATFRGARVAPARRNPTRVPLKEGGGEML